MTSKYKDQPAFPVTSDNFANPQSTGMTIREYAAIQLKVPDSGTDWLDAMIRTSQRNELAAKAMPEMLRELCDNAKRNGDRYEDPVEEVAAKFSHEAADTMQKASNP